MDRAPPEMLLCLNAAQSFTGADNGTGLSVLERQQALMMKWRQGQRQQQQQQEQPSYPNANDQMSMFSTPVQAQDFSGFMNTDQGLDELLIQAMKQDRGWSESVNPSGVEYCAGGVADGSGFDRSYTVPRTVSCPPTVAAAMAEAKAACQGKETNVPERHSSAVGRESSRKRKVEKTQGRKVNIEGQPKDKKMKESGQDGDSRITERHSNNKKTASNNSNKDHSADTSKENSKVTEVQKPDYIHVRARRGQATDSHSLAERVRREKISERMKYLQDLVPGCNKIVGKAGMLDEIINYVQSLQKQVEFLSMKVAAINPTIDFNFDSLFNKEDFTTIGPSVEMANPLHLQFNPLQQIVSCSGVETAVNTHEMGIRRTISAPVTIPETLVDQSCFNQIQHPSTCDIDWQNLYSMEFQHGKSASFFSQPYADRQKLACLDKLPSYF